MSTRRTFISLLGGAAAASWPLAARAQQPVKLPTIGFLGAAPSIESQRVAAFVQRLRELAWIDGRNLAIEYRWAEGRNERSAEIAVEFVRLKVDVIVTVATPPTLAAKQATSVIPPRRDLCGGRGAIFVPTATVGRIEIPQCSTLLPDRGVLSFRSEAREVSGQ